MTRRSIFLAVLLSMLLQAASICDLWRLAAFETRVDQWAAATQQFQRDVSADVQHHVGVDARWHPLGLIPAGIRHFTAPATGSHPELVAEASPVEPLLKGLRRPPRPLG